MSSLIDPRRFRVAEVRHQTGEGEDHSASDCPGATCPVIRDFANHPLLGRLVQKEATRG